MTLASPAGGLSSRRSPSSFFRAPALRLIRSALLLLPAWWASLAFAQEPASAPAPDPAPPPAAAPSPEEPAFDILEFRVEGNSVLPAREIERAVTPRLGPGRRFADVEAARRALEETYQKLGYQTVFVDIPEQKVGEGVVRLRVVEGTVSSQRVLGSRYFSLGEIRNRVPELAPGSVPDFNAVQEGLAQANRSADLQVAPVLRAGRNPGAVEVDLSVKDQFPLHAEFELDNHASPFTRALRANASVHYDNLWQRQHSLALNFQEAPSAPAQSKVVYGSYLWKFADHPDVLTAYAVRSDSNLALVGSTTVLGRASIAGMRWIRPLGGGAGFIHTVSLGADSKSFGQTNINAQTGAPDHLPAVHYVPLSAGYSANMPGPVVGGQFSVTLSSAPRGLFGNEDASFQGRRIVSHASWFTWKWDAASDIGLGRRASLHLGAGGQWTTDPLISNEQFSIGGSETVRGYREAEVPGDKGVHASLEARAHLRARGTPGDAKQWYAYVFGDCGVVRVNEPQGPQLAAPATGLSSYGLGMRIAGWYGITADIDGAAVLRDGGHATNGPITPRGAHRAGFSLGWSF
jgi:hemolysin activation/secretion protein